MNSNHNLNKMIAYIIKKKQKISPYPMNMWFRGMKPYCIFVLLK